MCDDKSNNAYHVISQRDFSHKLNHHDSFLNSGNAGGKLEARDFDLRKINFENHSLNKAVFQNCNLSGIDFSNTSVKACRFSHCDLSNAKFTDLDLESTQFIEKSLISGIVFERAAIKGTVFHQVELKNVEFINCKFHDGDTQTQFIQCTINGMDFTNITLLNVHFSGSTITNTNFCQATLLKVHINNKTTMENCCFINTIFYDPKSKLLLQIDDSNIHSCDFTSADLQYSIISGTEFTANILRNCNLSNARFDRVEIDDSDFTNAHGLYGRYSARISSIQGAEYAAYGSIWDVLNWKIIRSIGSLRLFGVSYFAIVAIILWISGTRWYNDQIIALQNNETIKDLPYVDNLHTIPISTETMLMFFAIVILAIGSSIYKYRCPTEIQENTETHWTLALKKQLMEYRSLSYSKIGWRWPCGICYLLGGGWILAHIIYRIVLTSKYMLNL